MQSESRSLIAGSARVCSALWHDVRHASRILRKSPGTTTAVLFVLALGTGANAAMFGVLDAAMFRPLPARDPQDLVAFGAAYPGERDSRYTFCYPTFEAFRRELHDFAVLSSVVLLERPAPATSGSLDATDHDQSSARIALVSGNYFSTLGVDAARGRTLMDEDERRGAAEPVAVVSDRFWRRHFHGEDLANATLTSDETTYRVIGVMPDGFSGDWVGRPADVWIPISMQSRVMPDRPGLLSNPTDPWVRVIGRLRPGASARSADAAAQESFQRWANDTFSASMMRYMSRIHLSLESLEKGFFPERKTVERPLTLLMIMALVVLSIACANIANLLLARSTARGREMTVRLALGATRGRLVRQFAVEHLLIAVAGCASGLIVTAWSLDVLIRIGASGLVPLDLDVKPDARVLSFAAVMCVGTALLFGLAPTIVGSGANIADSLKRAGSSRVPASGLPRPVRAAAVAQVALSIVLVCGAGLFARTLMTLHTNDFGFASRNVLLVWLSPAQAGLKGPELSAFYDAVQARISSLSGVQSAGLSHGVVAPTGFLSGAYFDYPLQMVDGQRFQIGEAQRSLWYAAGPGFFQTMGMRLVRGRDFSTIDREGAPRVAIVSESLARHFFGNEDPMGRLIAVQPDQPVAIVGVVNDARYNSPRDERRMLVFVPYMQYQGAPGLFGDTLLAVRPTTTTVSLAPDLRDRLREINPRVPILRINSIDAEIDRSLIEERLLAMLAGVFGVTALLITCVGLYGVMSYMAARRINEIGIRLALGASRGAISIMMLRESLWILAVGVAIGLPAALGGGQYVSSLLHGVRPSNPGVMAGATIIMLIVGLVAVMGPVRRAAELDPVVALRSE